MSSFWLLDDSCGGCVEVFELNPPCITVFVPLLGNSSLIDVGSRVSPVLITGSIAAPVFQTQRSWLKGNATPVTNPTLPNGVTNANGLVQVWQLATTDDTDTITLTGASNLQLSGPWTGGAGSILTLEWDNDSMWLEVGRNEI